LVTGIDLVKEQVAVAEGKPLELTQDDIVMKGHAIECRIYAEDPAAGFMPSTGKLKNYRIPAGPGVRVDSGVVIFSEIPIYYDPMIAKLAVWGKDREEAIARCLRALREYRIAGVESTIGFHRVVLQNERFKAGDFSTHFLEEEYPDNNYRRFKPELVEDAAIAAAVDRLLNERKIATSQSGGAAKERSAWQSFHRRETLRNFGGSR
jgi:acetyl/propionyl-CoA carboxylase alpha subunit